VGDVSVADYRSMSSVIYCSCFGNIFAAGAEPFYVLVARMALHAQTWLSVRFWLQADKLHHDAWPQQWQKADGGAWQFQGR